MASRNRIPRTNQDEAEKPFWISFADLMMALMVLFLVVMAVALLAVTNTVSEIEQKEQQHKVDIDQCLGLAVAAAKRHEGVKVDLQRRVIDFGDRARFAFGRSDLSTEQEGVFAPLCARAARHDRRQKLPSRPKARGGGGLYRQTRQLSEQPELEPDAQSARVVRHV